MFSTYQVLIFWYSVETLNFWAMISAWRSLISKALFKIITFIFGVKIATGNFSDCHIFGIMSVQSLVTITYNAKQWQHHKRHVKLIIAFYVFGKVWFYQAFPPLPNHPTSLFYPIPLALPTLELNPFIKRNQAKPIKASHMPTGYNSWF